MFNTNWGAAFATFVDCTDLAAASFFFCVYGCIVIGGDFMPSYSIVTWIASSNAVAYVVLALVDHGPYFPERLHGGFRMVLICAARDFFYTTAASIVTAVFAVCGLRGGSGPRVLELEWFGSSQLGRSFFCGSLLMLSTVLLIAGALCESLSLSGKMAMPSMSTKLVGWVARDSFNPCYSPFLLSGRTAPACLLEVMTCGCDVIDMVYLCREDPANTECKSLTVSLQFWPCTYESLEIFTYGALTEGAVSIIDAEGAAIPNNHTISRPEGACARCSKPLKHVLKFVKPSRISQVTLSSMVGDDETSFDAVVAIAPRSTCRSSASWWVVVGMSAAQGFLILRLLLNANCPPSICSRCSRNPAVGGDPIRLTRICSWFRRNPALGGDPLSIQTHLRKLLASGEHSDLIFEPLEPRDRRWQLRGHWLVLYARCDHMRNLVLRRSADQFNDSIDVILVPANISRDDTLRFLELIYTGDLPESNVVLGQLFNTIQYWYDTNLEVIVSKEIQRRALSNISVGQDFDALLSDLDYQRVINSNWGQPRNILEALRAVALEHIDGGGWHERHCLLETSVAKKGRVVLVDEERRFYACLVPRFRNSAAWLVRKDAFAARWVQKRGHLQYQQVDKIGSTTVGRSTASSTGDRMPHETVTMVLHLLMTDALPPIQDSADLVVALDWFCTSMEHLPSAKAAADAMLSSMVANLRAERNCPLLLDLGECAVRHELSQLKEALYAWYVEQRQHDLEFALDLQMCTISHRLFRSFIERYASERLGR